MANCGRLFINTKTTKRAREIFQPIGGRLRDFLVGGTPPRGNRAGGRAAARNLSFGRRSLWAEEEVLQAHH